MQRAKIKLTADNFPGWQAALEAEAKTLGLAKIGITEAALDDVHRQRLSEWVENGAHGDMDWMEGRIAERAQPQTLWPDVKSAIMLGMSYAPDKDPMRLAKARDHGRISVYAQGTDYHKTFKKALKNLARWVVETTSSEVKVFVDTAPVSEKPLAAKAGLGWQGKHTNLVSTSHGSWLFLGAIYTSAELPADTAETDHCGSCTACQDICPTNAFPAPYQLDARACISFLTIENKGPIPHQYRRAMGNHIYGCDDCLAACPWNKFADAAQRNKAYLPRAELTAPDLASLLAMDDAAFRGIFAGSPIKRTGRDRMVRNSLIAAGNSGNAGYVPQICTLLDDDSEIVRGAAIWALGELSPEHFAREREARASVETDPAVQTEWMLQCPVTNRPSPT
ncbi:tRNA epoxyqueuosine(34) reductase QueG [Sphingorhabdus sp. Alg239-R122]|uniref:tRNA epoxyqueuosine(34) reductase QueG n=1 Tax=Sphingorhabdus sp. Alg239-R122 TaxID=2305989 RepID=UPI0013DB460F|nr:tRNA epoxyqueuosine(34) reductase QueG [Sphingorhabdus sp. Alg239-R122]